MSKGDIVCAWKDAEYRQSLSAEEQALLPEHPAGTIELTDDQLSQAVGGITQNNFCLSEMGYTGCPAKCPASDGVSCNEGSCPATLVF